MCCNCDGPLVLLSDETQKSAKMTIFLVRHFDLTFGQGYRISTKMSAVNDYTI